MGNTFRLLGFKTLLLKTNVKEKYAMQPNNLKNLLHVTIHRLYLPLNPEYSSAAETDTTSKV